MSLSLRLTYPSACYPDPFTLQSDTLIGRNLQPLGAMTIGMNPATYQRLDDFPNGEAL